VPIQFSNWLWLLLLPFLFAYFIWLNSRTVTDMGAGRRRTALILRCVLVTLLVLALAGFKIVKKGESLAVVFLVDGSRSVREEQRPAIQTYLREAARGMRSVDKVAVITFAQDPHTQSALGQPLDAARLKDTGSTTASDIAQALRQAKNELDTAARDSGKRIVLISDGNENVGHALSEVPELAADHIVLDTITLPSTLTKEALIEKVVMPSRVKIGEPFPVRVVVNSLTPQTATLALTREGKPTGEPKTVELHAGKNVVAFDQNIDKKGFYRYGVTLDAPQDTIPENNKGEGFVWVLGKPTVLYVADNPALTGFLQRTLRSENIDVEYAPAEAMPTSPAALQRFDSVFLSNVPASALSNSQMTALQVACRDFGLGVGMVGGDTSFGAGGYRGTPLEETLPVSMDVKKQKRMPAVAVALVIEDLEIPTTVNMSKEAAKATMDLLEPIDQVGVLDCNAYGSGGDPTAASAAGTWRIPMQHVTDREALKAAMQNLEGMGDPPVYDPFLLEAARVLSNTDAKIKHMVFLGDGDAVYEQNQQAITANIKKISDMGITLSTIATGADKRGIQFMAALAKIGQGEAYVADKPQDLPRLLLKDQETISQPPIIEEPFRATPTDGDEILKGIDWAGAPPLLGYDVVNVKPTASLSLIDPNANRNDPIFAGWRYGLGRSIAFMSDDRAHWAAQWLNWPGYSKFWAQAVRWTLRPFAPSEYSTQVTLEGTRGHILVDAISDKGEYVNRLQIRALVAPPTLNGIKAPQPTEEILRQTGPGHYEGWFDAPQIGTYLVNVLQKNPDGKGPDRSTPIGLSTAYSPEYKETQSNRYLMTQLAHAGGGRTEPPAPAVFGGERPGIFAAKDMTWPMLLCAMLLLPFDIAVRRLAVDANDFRRALRVLIGATRGRRAAPRASSATPELGRLKERKADALAGRGEPEVAPTAATAADFTPAPSVAATAAPSPSPAHPAPPAPTAPPRTPTRTLRPEGLDDAAPTPAPPIVETPPAPAPSPEEAGMSRLMAAKRRAQQQQEKGDEK
jgi:Ca-activated chloride channel family protein